MSGLAAAAGWVRILGAVRAWHARLHVVIAFFLTLDHHEDKLGQKHYFSKSSLMLKPLTFRRVNAGEYISRSLMPFPHVPLSINVAFCVPCLPFIRLWPCIWIVRFAIGAVVVRRR